MKKLWIYGCSFSEPFNLEDGPEFDDNGYRRLTAPFWGTHLADALSVECICRSLSGVGWHYINSKIDEDVLKWDKDDIIIISPSFFARVTYEELVKRDLQSHDPTLFKPWHDVAKYTETQWVNKVNMLQHFGYNVYTWVVDTPRFVNLPEKLITPAEDMINWKEWMDVNHAYWCSLPGVVYPAGDWHFNEWGHCAVAEIMYKAICQKQQ